MMKLIITYLISSWILMGCTQPVKGTGVSASQEAKILSDTTKKSTIANFPEEYGQWTDFISERMVYPEMALEKGISRAVTASYYVEKDGSLTFIKLWKEKDSIYEKEIKRVIGLMPKWNPATRNGAAVQSRIGLTFPFYLSSQYTEARKKGDPENYIILKPEKVASFPGGNEALDKFITEKRAYENAHDGVIGILVVCEKDGSITHPEVVSSSGAVSKKRTDRIIAAMPKWNPALKNRQAVRSQILLNMSF